LLNELSSACGFNEDLREFHGAESAWVKASIHLATQEIHSLESGIDFRYAWYASYKPPLDPARCKRPGSSARSRLKAALPLMTDFERLAMGTTYEEAFGHPSSSIHYTAGATPSTPRGRSRPEISEATKLGMLGLCVVRRCWTLLGCPEGVIVEQVARVLESNTEASRYFGLLNQGRRVAVGDFVLARGFLGEVVEERTSKYGYRSLRVDLLAERPIPEIAGDWFRARDIALLFPRQNLEDGVSRLLGGDVALAGAADLRNSVRAAWDAGLREQVRGSRRHPPAPPPVEPKS
jgi:hypothetical protein